MTKYMIVETFKPGCRDAVYRRLEEHGRMMPAGLGYIDSWLEKDGDRCFQLVEADHSSLIELWTEKWEDLVSFDVIEVGQKPTDTE